MNLLPMSYFIEVVNQQGISRAAEKLQITQQTLSSHIAGLEKELGCTLFFRRPKFRLTAEGELFLEYCRRFVRLDQTMHREFRDLSGEVTGTVRVGISQTRSAILMPELISGFRKEYPKVRIHLSECTNDELLNRIGSDILDLIIGDVSEERPDLQVEELYRERMALVIPGTAEFAPLRDAIKKSLKKMPEEAEEEMPERMPEKAAEEMRDLPQAVRGGGGRVHLPGALYPLFPDAGGRLHGAAAALQLRDPYGGAEDRPPGRGHRPLCGALQEEPGCGR